MIKLLNLKGIFNNSKLDKTLFIIFTCTVKFYVHISGRRSIHMAAQGSIATSKLQNAITLGASSFEELGVYQMNCICGQNMNDYYHTWPIITLQ